MGNLEIDRTSMEPHFIVALTNLEQLSFDCTRSSREMALGRHWVSHSCAWKKWHSTVRLGWPPVGGEGASKQSGQFVPWLRVFLSRWLLALLPDVRQPRVHWKRVAQLNELLFLAVKRAILFPPHSRCTRYL